MTPKEKAEELLWKFNPNGIIWDVDHVWIGSEKAPQIIKKGISMLCKRPALIAVDEILNVIIGSYDYELENKYWQEVKQEIEKL